MRSTRVALAVVVALMGALVGLGMVANGSQAFACEKHERDCRGGGPPPGGPLVVRGTLTTDGGVFVLDARSQGGQASGVATLVLGPTGPVREVLPPGDGRDYYCVSIVRDETPGLRANFYIRDVGDGVTTFDQIAVFAGNPDLTCSNAAPPGSFFTATAGNIGVTR